MFYVSLLEFYQQQFEKKLLKSSKIMIDNQTKWVMKKIFDK